MTDSTPSTAPGSGYRFRWVICSLLFFATTANYLDRQVISFLKEYFCMPRSQGGFGWSNGDFSYLTSMFTGVYACFTVFAGWFIDRIGTKIGLALALVTWSVFGVCNAFVGRLLAMHILVRSAFAVGEAGNFPASIKTVAEWFPKRERALATGIFNSGSNFGAMVASLFVPWCLTYFGFERGWKLAFIFTGSIGFIWLFFWFRYYEIPARNRRLKKAEYDYIHSEEDVPAAGAAADQGKVRWPRLFAYRQSWAFISGKFLTDGIWWFYLFWLPDYLFKQFGMTPRQVELPTFTVYGVAIVGSIYGGGLPITFIKRGRPVYSARLLAMLLIALCPLAVLFTQYFGNVRHFGTTWAPILAVATICVGAAAHQAWSANLFTTVSDMFPKKAVASMIGIGTMAGGVGGVAVQLLAGRLTDVFRRTPEHAYLIMFVICAVSYLVAWAVIKSLVPRHRAITDL
ncbi:MAG: MFS transporter [Opitutaceae bacterium]